MSHSSPAPRRKSTVSSQTRELGNWGEAIAAQWLSQQGWQILDRQWRCRWGELDLVAQFCPTGAIAPRTNPTHPVIPILAFVEVKVRSRRNWDANGLLAITPQKQAKLQRAAQLYLTEHPRVEAFACRFDVALVQWWASRPQRAIAPALPERLELCQPVAIGGYCFSLEHYLEGAFEES
ncbi:MAG: YraN family protein [Synechococcales bacterium]|nr:YraN family protein [Synechococcales bacterium]